MRASRRSPTVSSFRLGREWSAGLEVLVFVFLIHDLVYHTLADVDELRHAPAPSELVRRNSGGGREHT